MRHALAIAALALLIAAVCGPDRTDRSKPGGEDRGEDVEFPPGVSEVVIEGRDSEHGNSARTRRVAPPEGG